MLHNFCDPRINFVASQDRSDLTILFCLFNETDSTAWRKAVFFLQEYSVYGHQVVFVI